MRMYYVQIVRRARELLATLSILWQEQDKETTGEHKIEGIKTLEGQFCIQQNRSASVLLAARWCYNRVVGSKATGQRCKGWGLRRQTRCSGLLLWSLWQLLPQCSNLSLMHHGEPWYHNNRLGVVFTCRFSTVSLFAFCCVCSLVLISFSLSNISAFSWQIYKHKTAVQG